MEHISLQDSVELYESIPLESVLQVWTNTAHEGTIKQLKKRMVAGVSLLARLQSSIYAEQMLLSLFFNQKITKRELKEQMSVAIGSNNNTEEFEAFNTALNKLQAARINLKMVSVVAVCAFESVFRFGFRIVQTDNITTTLRIFMFIHMLYTFQTSTLQLLVPEARAAAITAGKKRLKWALKYNPELISFDEGNVTAGVYDIEVAIAHASKYGRKLRIARW